MKAKYCQSCGMPMEGQSELFGTEKDGSKSNDYCAYCYKDGAFLFSGSKEEMIEICVKPMVENNPGMTESVAREMMGTFFPTLKRWKDQ